MDNRLRGAFVEICGGASSDLARHRLSLQTSFRPEPLAWHFDYITERGVELVGWPWLSYNQKYVRL